MVRISLFLDPFTTVLRRRQADLDLRCDVSRRRPAVHRSDPYRLAGKSGAVTTE